MARGAFPDSHPQHLGMPGMHGTVAAVHALQKADLIIALGARFDDRVTGKLDTFAPGAAIIHADIDPAEIGKNRAADVPIVGDARLRDRRADRRRRGRAQAGHRADLTDWWTQLDDLRERTRWARTSRPTARSHRSTSSSASARSPGRTASTSPASASTRCGRPSSSRTRTRAPGSTPAASARWATRCRPRWAPRSASPDTAVWAIDGDGCFQMTNQELATCALEGIPIKVAIINNGNLGMVRQWQTLFYDERYSNTDLGTHKHRIPDFVKLAEALGCVGLRCESAADVDATIEPAMKINDPPVVIDFVVGKDAMVWPMVAAGTSNDEIMFARDVRPIFDDDDV